MKVLGIDTSNYTCSAALFNSEDETIKMRKQLLPVPDGKIGLRQSQVVFEQVRLIGKIVTELLEGKENIQLVGVSSSPRADKNSYMPCFLVGHSVGQAISSCVGCNLHTFSHQHGHIAAALFSAKRLDLLQHHSFLAFHVSGGTTDCLLVETENYRINKTLLVGTSLDLKAGQVIDRVGALLNLSFPAGSQLEQLALQCQEKWNSYFPRAVLKNENCCLSGLENQCRNLQLQGKSPNYIARFCLLSIQMTIEGMLQKAMENYGNLPVLFSGGVMSNSILREYFTKKYQGVFAEPKFSSDNAAGIAVLSYLEEKYA